MKHCRNYVNHCMMVTHNWLLTGKCRLTCFWQIHSTFLLYDHQNQLSGIQAMTQLQEHSIYKKGYYFKIDNKDISQVMDQRKKYISSSNVADEALQLSALYWTETPRWQNLK